MPLKKDLEQIKRFYEKKATAPEVIKKRYEDVRELQSERWGWYAEIGYAVDEAIGKILNKYGISGGRRIDYYNFGRRVWAEYYGKSDNVAELFLRALWEYYRTTSELNENIMREIAEEMKKIAKEAKAREGRGAPATSGGGGGAEEAGDNSSR